MIDIIKSEIEVDFHNLLRIRRHIHANPELSFKEDETAKFIAEELTVMGIPFQEQVGGNGLVAIIEGELPGKVSALRADFDALPILEENDVEYASKNKGVMHACGHDVHTTCLLGAAKILWNNRPQLKGTVKLIFQHAEEMTPGGAIQMIKAGALESPRVQHITGQHVYPDLEVGKVGFKKGMYMASTDELFVTVKGKGGHAALPHKLADPVLATAQMIVGLQSVISRRRPPHVPSVLSFGKVEAAGSTNVIPHEVHLMGTFRAMDEIWRAEALDLMPKMAKTICAAFGVEVDFNISNGYPFLVNDDDLTETNIQLAKEFLGKENVVDLDLRMTGEDFSYYGHEIPACFYRLGTRNESLGITHGLHTPKFNVDEESIKVGAGLMAWLAFQGN